MKKIITLISLLLIVRLFAFAQEEGQVLKGRILDAQSKFPLMGATVLLVGSDPPKGATADQDGYFKIEGVAFGRVSIKISFIGYEDRVITNLLVSPGKETVVNADLKESIMTTDVVVIRADEENGVPKNEFATNSVRTFDVEETRRYAGSRNDSARMATNFAGVSGANDGRNDIIIRGNSPTGVLWRLNGLDIPSPNHFSSLGTTGGPVSMLNNNLLSNSDFFTGAFPAGYGNALAGVFDLNMRVGNADKREYLGQIGFNGFEFGAEGPFKKGGRASYLINYRYSVLGVFKAMGLRIGTGAAVPEYQDLSFSVNLPTQKAGTFTVFGLGGISNINLLGSEQDDQEIFGDLERDIYNKTSTGIAGVSHTYFFSPTTYLRTIVAASGQQEMADIDTVYRNAASKVLGTQRLFRRDFTQTKYTFNTKLNKKFNAKNNASVGVIIENIRGDFKQTNLLDSLRGEGVNFDGNSNLVQGYANWQHRFNDRLTMNLGLHSMFFGLNNSFALEPRAGLSYKVTPSQTLSVSYGRHSQAQGAQVYFVESYTQTGQVVESNRNLDFTLSDHYVLGYNWNIFRDLNFKFETYYQNLHNVPIERHPSTFSMLNAGADFGLPTNDSLVNEGTGWNAGVEFTVEKYFNKSYYFLTTLSLFDAKYTASALGAKFQTI